MAKSPIEIVKSARRSLARVADQSLIEYAINSGKTEEKLKGFYSGRLSELRKALNELDLLLTSEKLSESQGELVSTACGKIPEYISKIRRGKIGLRDLGLLSDELKPVILDLKEQSLNRRIAAFEAAESQLNKSVNRANQAAQKAEAMAKLVSESSSESLQLTKLNKDTVKEFENSRRMVERRKEKVLQLLAEAQAVKGNIDALDGQVSGTARSVRSIQSQLENFANSIEKHLDEMRGMQSKITRAIAVSESQKDDYLHKLSKIEERANQALLRATAGSLFGTFEQRRNEIAKKVNNLAIALYLSVAFGVAASVSVWIISQKNQWPISEQMVAKLGILGPFVFLIWFLAVQYNRERLLEEEYSSKANMSAAYPAFRAELVELTQSDDVMRGKAIDAAIDLTREIFADPLLAFKPTRGVAPKRGSKEGESAKPEVVTSDEGASEAIKKLTDKISSVFDATSNLIEKAAALAQTKE